MSDTLWDTASRPGSCAWASSRIWDLVVVGGGTAGIVGAKTAARLGAQVLLIERGQPGGDCAHASTEK